MRALKILGLGLVGLMLFVGIVVTAVAVGGAPLVARVIENQGSALLGRHIHLARLVISWGRPTRIVAEHITVANAAWGSSPNMLAVGRLEMEIEPGALLGLKLVVPHLTLEEGSLLLETAMDGERNWAPFAAAVGARQQRPQVQRLLIRNGTFRYHNGQTGAETDVATDELVAETTDGVSPINITAKGTFQQDRFALTAAVGAVGQLQSASEPYPVKLKGSLGANDIALNGMIADPLATQGLDLHVEMNGQDIQEVLATLGVPIPKMPIYQLSGQVQRDGQKWWLEQVTGRVGASLLAGRILVDTGRHVPYIRADLTSSFLDLADLQGLYGGEPNRQLPLQDEKTPSSNPAEKKSSRVIPDVRLPIGKLLGFDADFSLDSSNVKPTDGFPFEHFTLGISLKDGTLRLKPVRVAIARGELLADLEYRSAETPPHFRGDIEVHHIDLAKLFAGAAVSNSLRQTAGIIGGFAKLSSAGTSQRQILSQLDGDVGIFVQGGRLGQKMGGAFESSLAEALGLIAKKDEPPHPVNCLIGRVKVARGVATAETLLLDTTETIVVGRGNINVGDETIFLDFRPYAKRGSARRIGVPFAIRGTFADPSVTADKVGLIARLGAAIGIGDETPPGALLRLLEAGLGEKNSCGNVFSKREPAGQGTTTAPRQSR
jgi:AsmA family protein